MNILVTGAWNYKDSYLEEIKKLGHNIFILKDESNAIPVEYNKIDGVICNGLFLHHPIEKFINLKYIQLTSVGYDRVPMDYVKKNNIKIFNAKGVYSVPMAEYAITGILNLYKNFNTFMINKNNHRWEKQRTQYELFNKKVCIVGCGNVGTECAKRLNAFGCYVYGIDLFPYKNEYFKEMYSIDNIKEKISDANIVILTLPLTNETENLFDKDMFDCMKEKSIFVNIARGKIVNQKDLINSLKNKLFGAVLDVFNEEPLEEESELWKLENTIITPHNSFVGEGNNERLYKVIMENLK